MKRGIMALEELELVEDSLNLDLAKELGENRLGFDEAMTNIANTQYDMDAATDVVDTLETISGEVENRSDLSEAGAAALNVAVEHLIRSIGYTKKNTIAFESFKNNKIALEETKGFIASVWEAIKTALAKIYDWFSNAIKHLFGMGKNNQEKAKEVENKIQQLVTSSSSAEVTEVEREVEKATSGNDVIAEGEFTGTLDKEESTPEAKPEQPAAEKQTPTPKKEQPAPKTEKDFSAQYLASKPLAKYFRKKPKSFGDSNQVRSILDGASRFYKEEAEIYKAFSSMNDFLGKDRKIEDIHSSFGKSLANLSKVQIHEIKGKLSSYSANWSEFSDETYEGSIVFPFDSTLKLELKKPRNARLTAEPFEADNSEHNVVRLCTIQEAKDIIKAVKSSNDVGKPQLEAIQKALVDVRKNFDEAFENAKKDVELPEGHMGDPEEMRKNKLKYQTEQYTCKKNYLGFALQLITQTYRYKENLNSHLLQWANSSITQYEHLLRK